MMNSLFAGVSGLRNHLVRMNIIGNNIANINTVGFKASRVTFKEMLAQTMRGASRRTGGMGGMNPLQYGLGMSVSSIDTIISQGNLEMTGEVTDLAIKGDGFFILSDGVNEYYTRAGVFAYDAGGNLVNRGNGFVLQGKMVDSTTGKVPPDAAIGDIRLPFGQTAPARATTEVAISGNLDASASEDDTHEASITVYDSLGDRHTLTITFRKTAVPNQWAWSISTTGVKSGTTPGGDTGTLTFGDDGSILEFTPNGGRGTPFTFVPDNGAKKLDIVFNLGTGSDGITQYAAAMTATAKWQDGYGMGTLSSISIDSSGMISGVFTNGVTRDLAQIVLADFNNPAGLLKVGENMYQVSSNSGDAIKGVAGSTISGTISSGYLERSNVDLAREFIDMIVAQRGFQANARTITTTDEMLGELVNLKR